MKTYRTTPSLAKSFDGGKFREDTQRYLVARALLKLQHANLDILVKTLNNPVYWSTVRRKDQNGNPAADSWFVQEGGGVRASISYHLRALEKARLVEAAI
jgi:DNA-binding transcriptional ArsR family regulator